MKFLARHATTYDVADTDELPSERKHVLPYVNNLTLASVTPVAAVSAWPFRYSSES